MGEEARYVDSRQDQLIADFVNRRVWAVVGASQDRSKFGNRVFRALHSAGYRVYPVNPKGGELTGVSVFASLSDLPEMPDVVDTVVPPQATEEVVKEAARLGIKRVWMQPGSESEAAIAYCAEHGIQVVYGACAMIHRKIWS